MAQQRENKRKMKMLLIVNKTSRIPNLGLLLSEHRPADVFRGKFTQ